MGRLAHVLGIASGLALAATAVLAYLIEHWTFFSEQEYFALLSWLVPLCAGLAISIIALIIKWEPYFADRVEPHFIMSLVAVAVPAILIGLIVLDELDKFTLGRPDWLYPASLLGISLTMISLAMTWEGTGRRKMICISAAVFPPVLLIFPMIFRFTDVELASILPMAYLGSAVAIQLSGSMLHIIASSTSVLQREVLKASDGKLKEQVQDLDKKKKALEYREDALRSKESDLEAYEKRLSEELESVEERKKQIVALESELEQRVELARSSRQELTKNEVGIESKLETLRLKDAEVETKVRDLDRRAKGLAAREEKAAAAENEAQKLLLDAQSRDRAVKNRQAEVEAEENTLLNRMKQLDSLKASLVERERQISARESALDMKSLEVVSAKAQLGKAVAEKNAAKSLEQQLLARQAVISEKEIAVRTKEEELRKEAEKAQRLISRADKQMNELVDKEHALLVKEKSLSDKEASLRTAVEVLNAQMEEAQRSKVALSDLETQYHSLSETTRSRITEMSARDDEASRRMSALDRREENVKELDKRLRTEQERMNSKLRELLEKEKDLEAKEADVGLKQAELKAMEREMLSQVEGVAEARAQVPAYSDGHAKTMEVRERHLREKEQEVKSRLYLREKELEKREQALQTRLKHDIEEMEEQVEEEYAEEKVKTGIERLDDLLMGGIPFASNLLYVGPPFIGKEVAMLLFLAEGLRKGIPVVIVTTSHPPVELAHDMAPILPTFMEFEQLGLVHWIDASGAQADPNGASQGFSNVQRVKGADDFEGIQKALDGCLKDFEKQEQPYFRLAYMSLSLSVTRADDKRSFQFVQGVAGRIRQSRGIAVYAVERGMHTEQQLESIQHQMTGAVLFKTDKQKTLLSVQGVGDAQTRDWIDYRHTNKAIMIGAFSLERIR